MMMCRFGHKFDGRVPDGVYVLTDGRSRSSYGPDPFARIHGVGYAKISGYDILTPLLPLEFFA